MGKGDKNDNFQTNPSPQKKAKYTKRNWNYYLKKK